MWRADSACGNIRFLIQEHFMTIRSGRLTAAVVSVAFVSVLLSGCGGGGAVGDAAPAGPSKLFVADSDNQAIGSLANSNPRPGTIVIDRVVIGPATRLGTSLRGLDYDAEADRLFVLTDDMERQEILVFDNASEADGNVAPRRLAALPGSFDGSGSGALRALQFDAGRKLLYVVNASGQVSVFTNADTSIDVVASRQFIDKTVLTFFSTGMALDPGRDRIYLLGSWTDPTLPGMPSLPPMTFINRFDNASTRSGEVMADRSASMDGQTFRWAGLALDRTRDKLYAGINGGISVFDDASGALTTSRRIVLAGGANQYKLAVDSVHDRLYAIDSEHLFVIPNASTATGTITATALFAPDAGILTAVAVTP
jgi:hypothetical protein